MKILIVDDSTTMVRIIGNMLKKLGHETSDAGNGKEAMVKLAASVPDLIITDWNMPEMGGVQFVETVRSQPSIAKTPILMIGTAAAKEDTLVALQVGVNDYLIKPFTPLALKEKIESLLPVSR
ncbi:MAG TPA: response regulator [Candidatus Paceibacterota bacterium]